MKLIGHISRLVRYPVKSMAGLAIESAILGWHGLEGDRRFAFRRLGESGGFPWLTASRLPELLLYHPLGVDQSAGGLLPTHIRTPTGATIELRSPALAKEIGERFGTPVELMQLKHGIFDDACISVISSATIAEIGREAGIQLDPRRFRANILLETYDGFPFEEDDWAGGRLVFGDGDPSPSVSITACDPRCVMINLDPDSAEQDGRVMKAAVKLNANNAGVYGTIVQRGRLQVGQTVKLILDGAR
jgi:uncharacterized protein YcbX